jgi:myo-inositol 2-dehydrogenase / D-chiro-inositol 1-dehydrogenase
MSPQSSVTRRDFLGSVAATGAAWLVPSRPSTQMTGPPRAPDGRPLTAGLIGCGGRGRGAATDFLAAGDDLRITALADVFQDRLEEARRLLRDQGQDIPDSRCFVGFDAYQRLIGSGVDVVLQATPPHFRPEHFAAAVDAGKHCFLEKPVAVDGAGVQRVIAIAEKAASSGLSVMTGTQLRRDLVHMETRNRVLDGAIGDIVAIRAFRNQGALWHRKREPGWSDMEAMLRDWVNWTWLSGDCIVEMHIHHLDQVVWITGKMPVRALGMGGRARRATGDQYDFFSVDYAFDDGVHMHTTIRQVDGCANETEEILVGTRGTANLRGVIQDRRGQVIWQFAGEKNNPLVQEHVDFVSAIRAGKPVNQARDTALSTLMAIMGRDSAYSGQAVTLEEASRSTTRLGPVNYALGPVTIAADVPVPGRES